MEKALQRREAEPEAALRSFILPCVRLHRFSALQGFSVAASRTLLPAGGRHNAVHPQINH